MDSRGGSLKDIEKRLLQYRRGSRGGSEELAEIDVTDASRGSGLTPWVNGSDIFCNNTDKRITLRVRTVLDM